MQEDLLVSIGIPTYNRPEGLRRTLESITSQTYRNLEIIISDNASKNELVRQVVLDFQKTDSRILFFEQEEGIGIVNNFRFVLKKATGKYFIWAADDDQWQGTGFLETLLAHAPSKALVFPDAVLSYGDGRMEYPLKAYEKCSDDIDYTRVFCSNGVGHPFYGLYNLKLFDLSSELKVDEDLSYYQEGTFLHKLFLKGSVKYVKEAKILYSDSIARSSTETQLNDFFKYFNRVILIYAQADLPPAVKTDLIDEIFKNYEAHIKRLMSVIVGEKTHEKIESRLRMKKALKVLLKGRL